MTFTKIFGSAAGALLVFLLVNWVSGGIFTESEKVGPDGKVEQAYTIDTGEGSTATAEKTAEPTFDELYASADVAKGKKVFNKCKACHKVDGNNATGPHLNGVVGRPVGSVADFNYSDAIKGLGGDWTPDRLQQYLTDPKAYAPGNKMGFAGLKKTQDRADVIAYLASLK